MTDVIFNVVYALFGDAVSYAAAVTIALLLLVMLVIFVARGLSGDFD